MLRTALGRNVTGVGHLLHGLRATGRGEDASRWLALAAQREWSDVSSLIIGLRKSGNDADADQMLTRAAQRSPGDICNISASLRADGDLMNVKRLLALTAATLPVNEIVSLIECLLKQDPPSIDLLWPNLAGQSLETVAGVVHLIAQRHVEVDVSRLVSLISRCWDDDVAAFICTFYRLGPGADADSMLRMVAQGRSLVEAYSLASSVRAMGMPAAGNRLLKLAVVNSSLKETIPFAGALRANYAAEDADIVLDAIAERASPADALTIIMELRSAARLNPDARRVLSAFGTSRSQEDIAELEKQLRLHGCHNEADRLLKPPERRARRSPGRLARIWGEVSEEDSRRM